LIGNLNSWHPAAAHKDEAKFKRISRMEVWA